MATTLRVSTCRHSDSADETRHWADVATLPGDRTVLTTGAIAVTVPHTSDLVGWLAEESRTAALRDRPPVATLNRLAALVAGSAAHTVGAACLRHDPAAQSIAVANAGYGAAVLVAPDGHTRVVTVANDRTLGVGQGRRTASRVAFPIGSFLVVHAHTPGCSSRGPSAEDVRSEVNEARLYTRGPTSQAAVCASLATTLRCDNERDESVVLLLAAAAEGADDEAPHSEFTGAPASAAAARAFTLRTMDEWRLVGPANRAAAIVGELAANAIQHARTPFSVRLRRQPAAVRIEVRDECHDLPHSMVAEPYDPGHRGLLIVETLARQWGVEPTEKGKTVWAELLIEPGA